jgi:hypothetical protein
MVIVMLVVVTLPGLFIRIPVAITQGKRSRNNENASRVHTA